MPRGPPPAWADITGFTLPAPGASAQPPWTFPRTIGKSSRNAWRWNGIGGTANLHLMEIREFEQESALPNVPEDVVAFDLELANSFQSEPSVICMIGVGTYDAGKQVSRAAIASITEREEEAKLIGWLLEFLETFRAKHKAARLLSFSGSDNDIRWLNDRLTRLAIDSPETSVLNQIGHTDLKIEFYRRTQNSRISLKRLEEVFGITRKSSVTSRKVSYILTDVVKNQRNERPIPERLYDYLWEDVHHLLLIQDRWDQVSLKQFNLTDEEMHELVTSILRAADRFIGNQKIRNGYKMEFALIKDYRADLKSRFQRVLEEETFKGFALPEFPEVRLRHPEYERLRKKHRHLNSIEIVDVETGDYRLRRELFRPKGALAVVRREGRLLLIRRAETLARAAGFWGLPGGEVEKGESAEDCALRELAEEVNLEGRVLQVLGKSSSYNGEFELTWVEIEVDDVSTLRPDPSEVGEARWVSPEEVGSLNPLIPGAAEGFSSMLGKDWG